MRNINTIAHAAMLNAYMKKSVQVEAEHVKAVIERHIDSQRGTEGPRYGLKTGGPHINHCCYSLLNQPFTGVMS